MDSAMLMVDVVLMHWCGGDNWDGLSPEAASHDGLVTPVSFPQPPHEHTLQLHTNDKHGIIHVFQPIGSSDPASLAFLRSRRDRAGVSSACITSRCRRLRRRLGLQRSDLWRCQEPSARTTRSPTSVFVSRLVEVRLWDEETA
jgi:hypothetical protein